MASSQELDLTIYQGKTFGITLQWATEPYVYKAISAISNTAPVSLTVTNHGMPDGWKFAVSGVKGTTELNASKSPPDPKKDYYTGTVVDANTIEINTINGMDLSPYRSDGAIQYLTPVDMTGMSARLKIKDRIGGTELLSLSSADGDITIDTNAYTIAIRIEPDVTEAITWSTGVYDLEMFTANDVYLLCYGAVTVTEEVTTNG